MATTKKAAESKEPQAAENAPAESAGQEGAAPEPEAQQPPAEATQPEAPAAESKPTTYEYVAIWPLLRGREIQPGEIVAFAEHEAEHVRELLERGYIAMKHEAEALLEKARVAREDAARRAVGEP